MSHPSSWHVSDSSHMLLRVLLDVSVHTFLNCSPGYSVVSCSCVSLSVSSGRATSTTFRPWSARRLAMDLPIPAGPHKSVLQVALLVPAMVASELHLTAKAQESYQRVYLF